MFRFTLREPDRGRRRFTSREWRVSLTIPRFWRRCMCGFRTRGSGYFDGMDSHRGDCPAQPRYVGTVAKGWWHLLTFRDDYSRWDWTAIFAVGGEDNMVQFKIRLPLLGLVSAGVAVPRSWTRRWVYQRREFGVTVYKLVFPTFLFGYDEDAKDMRRHYARPSCERCRRPAHCHPGEPDYNASNTNHAPPYCDGYVMGWRPPWLALVAGAKVEFPRLRSWYRLQNRILGTVEMVDTVLKMYSDVHVPLPEGDYRGTVTFYRSRVKRPRWRVIRDEVYGKFETDEWMPWPGKGENSYDLGDDGSQEHTERIGPGRMQEWEIDGEDVAKVVAGTVAKVLRYRARYGRFDWKPAGVGVMRP